MSDAKIARCRSALAAGQVALIPTDTVYGVAAHLDDPQAVAALYALKGRPRSQSCQVILFAPDHLDRALAELPAQIAGAVRALLPGTSTCIVPDPAGRFAAAAGDSPGSVGLRVPLMDPAFAALDLPLIATSANHPGGRDPARVTDVPQDVRDQVGAILDLGPLPGVASAVIDLRTPPVADLIRPGPDPRQLARRLADHGWSVREPEGSPGPKSSPGRH